MKKLLSILSIGTIISISTNSVISCRNSNSTQKPDITENKFNAINAKKANEAYNGIREQVASWASPVVTSQEIKNDAYIHITLYESDGTSEISDTTAIIDHKIDYKVKIKIDEQDIYFEQMDTTTYNNVEIGINLPSADEITLNDAIAGTTTWKDVKDDVAAKIANATGTDKVSIISEIDNAAMSLQMKDGNGIDDVTDNNTFEIVGDKGKVIVNSSKVSDFNMETINYEIKVVSS